MRLENKVALVTGGGTGIGAATARRFAAEGARLVLVGLEPEPLEEVARELAAAAIPGDVADGAVARQAVATAIDRHGGLDVVAACAGSPEGGNLVDMEEALWNQSIRNNLQSAASTCRAAVPALIDRGGGSIVVISSVGGLSAGAGIASYSTAKAGLLGLVRSLAVDFGPQGIRANAVCPGWVRTRMSEGVLERVATQRVITVEAALDRLNAVVPLRRFASPEEIANVCLFLASDEASFVTGSAVVADGGQMAVNVGTVPLVLE